MTPYYKEKNVEIYNGDCVSILQELGNVDLVLTDPPYNLGIKYDGHNDEKENQEYKQWCEEIFKILLTKVDTGIIMTVGIQNLAMWCGIKPPKEIAAWVHKNGVSGGRVSYLSLWEPILFWGNFKRDSRATNLFEYNLATQETDKEHPCPKQVKLFNDLIHHFSKPGSVILDPFMGSGTTLVSAKSLNRRAIGIEQSKKYCDLAVQRLMQEYFVF